jgi:hypothetical protein
MKRTVSVWPIISSIIVITIFSIKLSFAQDTLVIANLKKLNYNLKATNDTLDMLIEKLCQNGLIVDSIHTTEFPYLIQHPESVNIWMEMKSTRGQLMYEHVVKRLRDLGNLLSPVTMSCALLVPILHEEQIGLLEAGHEALLANADSVKEKRDTVEVIFVRKNERDNLLLVVVGVQTLLTILLAIKLKVF